MSATLLVVLGVLAFAVFYFIAVYNGLIKMKNRVDEADSDIDVQLKRRHDLIPNLLATVKGYAAHEKGTFEAVTKARTAAMEAMAGNNTQAKAEAENMLSGALKSIFALSENYPDLKANQNFLELQRELTDTEDKIQASRRFYNGNVRDFNIKIETFPSNIIAGMMNFVKREYFEIDEAQKENVKVEF